MSWLEFPAAENQPTQKKLLEQNPDAVYLASDLIRKELYGSESITGDKNKVFRLLHSRVKEELKKDKTVIFDATNLTRKARRNAFEDAKGPVIKEVHIVWAPIHACIDRDKKRTRVVGRKDIMRLATGFQAPWWDEGMDTIKIIVTHPPHNYTRYINRCKRDMQIPHDNPYHSLSVWDHCVAARVHAIDAHYPETVIYAALFHDIGKPITKTFREDPKTGNQIAHYYQHDNIGGWMAYGITSDPEQAIELAWLIGNHMQPYFNTKYYQNLDPRYRELIDQLHDCDVQAH